ncbi:protein zwilch homolog [Ceratina calcarata]|uniref:Protein zwilch n=1 Tax=Ceratina calcarata TaxID=156304 RepID=A0AAJ7J7V8_9HYME|nr:protein zwilch homolog [Ceratina calcarata]
MLLKYEELKHILDPSIKISNFRLSYVNRIFPELKNTPCIILHKETHLCDSPSDQFIYTANDETSQLDLTGSPLKYSFGEVDFDDSTVTLLKQNWCKDEEKYLPLSRTEACAALNECIRFLNNTFPPIFALCDEKDKKRSRLLGTIIEGEWFTTIEVYSDGIETIENVKKSSNFFQQHLELSHACEQDINISAFNTFNLFGTKEETFEWNDNKENNFQGSLSVEVDTCTLSLHSPTSSSKNNLVVQVVTNSDKNGLSELWKQLLMLNQYLDIIENYRKNAHFRHSSKPLEFSKDFISPYKEDHDNVLNNINLLLNGDYGYREKKGSNEHFLNGEEVDTDIRIYQYIENLPFRSNLDFTDFLWELLIKNSSYFEMIECMHTVFENIIMNGYLPQINFTNSTRFAKMIANQHQENIISNLLSGSLPLEYVIDMGFEKLCKDYMYVLISTRFGELHNIQKELKNMTCNEFSVDTYRNKLIYLAQIHICLEFMLLLQDNLECSNDDLRALFYCAFKQYVGEKSPLKDHQDLHKNRIYTLTASLPITAVDNLNKEMPNTRRISLSSQSQLSKLTTIRYYSHSPIFPTNIYPLDQSNLTNEGYHAITAICSSNKFRIQK